MMRNTGVCLILSLKSFCQFSRGGFVVQELLGYNSSRALKIYMHVIDKNV